MHRTLISRAKIIAKKRKKDRNKILTMLNISSVGEDDLTNDSLENIVPRRRRKKFMPRFLNQKRMSNAHTQNKLRFDSIRRTKREKRLSNFLIIDRELCIRNIDVSDISSASMKFS